MGVTEIDGNVYPDSAYLRDHPKWMDLMKTLDHVWPLVKDWRIAVDGGAFAGVWAKEMASRFERVFAFEPVPLNYQCVLHNVPLNVAPIRAALGGHVGEVHMKIKGAHQAEISPGGGLVAPCLTIDSLELPSLGFLKLDVEQLEIPALNGAQETLVRCRPVICIETKWNREEIADWLTQHDYEHQETRLVDEIWTAK